MVSELLIIYVPCGQVKMLIKLIFLVQIGSIHILREVRYPRVSPVCLTWKNLMTYPVFIIEVYQLRPIHVFTFLVSFLVNNQKGRKGSKNGGGGNARRYSSFRKKGYYSSLNQNFLYYVLCLLFPRIIYYVNIYFTYLHLIIHYIY